MKKSIKKGMGKKALSFVLTACLCLPFAACSKGSSTTGAAASSAAGGSAASTTSTPGGASSTPAATNGKFTGSSSDSYYMISFLSGIDYWKHCYTGMEAAGKELGVNTQYTGQTDSDVTGECSVFEQVVAKKPKGIAVTCVNSTAMADDINDAIKQGISVVTFDSDSPTSNRAAYLSTGNEAAGEKAAEYLANKVNKQGKIAILYTVGSENTESRVKGFESWCAKNAPNLKFVKVDDAGDTTKGTENLTAALQSNSDITGVFCADGTAGTAGPTAISESGKKVHCLAFDVDKSVLDKVKSGEIDATVAQGMYNMGYWSMMFMYVQANGLSTSALPKNVDTGVTIVEKDTVDNYYSK